MSETSTTLHRDLSQCPLCDYSLHGLPPRHRCPECGFEYDKSMQVFGTDAALERAAFAIATVLMGGFFIFGALRGVWARTAAWGVVLVAPWIILRRRGGSYRFVVSPSGLLIRHRNRVQTLLWADVEAVDYDRVSGVVWVSGSHVSSPQSFSYHCFGGVRHAKAFVEAANQRRNSFSDAAAPAPIR